MLRNSELYKTCASSVTTFVVIKSNVGNATSAEFLFLELRNINYNCNFLMHQPVRTKRPFLLDL